MSKLFAKTISRQQMSALTDKELIIDGSFHRVFLYSHTLNKTYNLKLFSLFTILKQDVRRSREGNGPHLLIIHKIYRVS